ncbi:hypothetical protein SAMN05216386_0989 [Nitrosospira briensis]|uniref:Uncharacterized protein n=1 Tax=Nitrosospira briensis TaxID=35799 RepID=A0A1I4Z217_9PROT|nr:hypothetical protein [Nitrosospira briensis]SFN44305.1 hypothetical protein SAMN05216386_0989 [Nitrosospira briensis]
MKTILLSPLAPCAVVFAVLMKSAVLWAAEPMRLTGMQMDTVTAGTVAVGMGAFATAEGSNTHTHTSTSTNVIGTPKDIVDIGLGFADAYACCGSGSDTSVETAYYAEGDIVIANSIIKDNDRLWFSSSHGVTTIIAVDIPLR